MLTAPMAHIALFQFSGSSSEQSCALWDVSGTRRRKKGQMQALIASLAVSSKCKGSVTA
jgi:hypothetical protein